MRVTEVAFEYVVTISGRVAPIIGSEMHSGTSLKTVGAAAVALRTRAPIVVTARVVEAMAISFSS
jgi:hypothetical protein